MNIGWVRLDFLQECNLLLSSQSSVVVKDTGFVFTHMDKSRFGLINIYKVCNKSLKIERSQSHLLHKATCVLYN